MPGTSTSLRLAALALLLGGGSACKLHDQDEGNYVFTAQLPALRDDCNLLTTPDGLMGGNIQISGNVIRLQLELRKNLQMVGSFEFDAQKFFLDGSASNVSTYVRGHECLLDLIQLHIDGTTESDTRFQGTLRESYQSSRNTESCVCELWVLFEATKT